MRRPLILIDNQFPSNIGGELASSELEFYECAQPEFYRLAASASLAPHDPTLSVRWPCIVLESNTHDTAVNKGLLASRCDQ